MKQVKRLFYMVLLNVLISAITVGVILQLWEKDHPSIPAESTPVVIVVTPTQVIRMPLVGNQIAAGEVTAMEANVVISGTLQASPTIELLTYRVKEGDTLGALAVQFNLGIADLMIANGLTDPDSLSVGQLIFIPTAPLPKASPTSIPTTPAVTPTQRPSITPTRGPAHTATPTPPSQTAQVHIETVIGAGVLENERVVLRRTGEGELPLAGWRLLDGMGMEYIFPQLTLYKDGSINLNTRSGQNTVVDLFLGMASAIWSPGETISLYDSENTLRATYKIP